MIWALAGGMSVQAAYNEWSASYDTDRNLTRDLDAQVTREALAAQRVGTVLELGCGTGKNTGLLADVGRQVVALDFSAGMIEQARAKWPLAHVTFAQADLTQPWPVESGTVELISGNLVLEHIENLDFIMAEAARVLVPGGRIFLSELHPFRQYQGGLARYQKDGVTTQIPAFVHHVSEFLGAASRHGLVLESLREWWHAEDQGKPPRLLTLLFSRPIKLTEISR